MQTKKVFQVITFLFLVFIISFLIRLRNSGGLVAITNDIQAEQIYVIDFEFDKEKIILFGDYYTSDPSKNLFEITQDISSQKNWEFKFEDYGDMGILINKIRDKENGQDQKYWQYFVDGQQPQISVDKYFPPNGSHIEWKFIKSEF